MTLFNGAVAVHRPGKPSLAATGLVEMKASKKKKALFAAIGVVTALFFLGAFASWALMLRMRIANNQIFTKSEPTYFSLINIPYGAESRLVFLVNPTRGI